MNKQVNILNKKAKFEYQLLDQYNAGIVLNEMNEAHYKNAINSESNLDIELIKKGAKEYFSLTEGTQRYLSIYQEIYE